MANPVLNEKTLERASGWAAPQRAQSNFSPPGPGTVTGPIDDGPVSPWPGQAPAGHGGPGQDSIIGSDRTMTVDGTIAKTAILFIVLLISGAVGWALTQPIGYDEFGNAEIGLPMLAWIGMVAGFGLTIFLGFRPQLSPIIAPLYAVAEGFFIGALSKMYETYYDGIVVQAIGATLAVFAVMLILYRTRIVRVTQRMRSIVIAATMGVMVFYVINFLSSLIFQRSASFLAQPTLLGIGFSVLVSALAAFNLLLDFDLIEKGAQRRLDTNFEWYAAFGLLVTVVWLYLELLRLLSKLRSR